MPIFELTGESLNPIDDSTFAIMGLRERQDLQKAIRSSIKAITPDVDTMVLAEEFGAWDGANRRIDLLCLDSDANLVVVELKREGSAHMELQALRYAAMVSTMRFDQAVDAHRKYLRSIVSEEDPEEAIRTFLGMDPDEPGALSQKVRIVLAASDFHSELTTAVLWLNEQGLDIRCVQLRPHQFGDRILVDIQQVIPLPEATDYQIAVREKTQEQKAAYRTNTRDFTKYDLKIGDKILESLPKRRLIYEIVSEAIKRGVHPGQISMAINWKKMDKLFFIFDQNLDPEIQFQQIDRARFFCEPSELFHLDGKSYALDNQWGSRTIEGADNVIALLTTGPEVKYFPTGSNP